MGNWTTFGIDALKSGIGAILGIGTSAATGAINSAFTNQMNQKNLALQNKYWNEQNEKLFAQNELAADNALARQYQLYNDLQSPQAMVEQLKKAGLNPALMYSQSGMGGHTTSAPQGGAMNAPMPNMLGLQQFVDPMTIAQIANIQADTELKKEQTKNTAFDTTLKKSIEKLNNSQRKLNELDWEFKDVSFWNNYNKLYYSMLKMQGEAMEAIENGTLAQESYEDRLAQYALQNIKTYAEIFLLQSKTELNEAQKQEALAEARNLTAELELIAAKTTFYQERTNQAIADTRLSEEQAEQILRKYSWKYFTKEDLFKAWDNINGTAEAVAEFIPLTKLGQLVTETITYDSTGKQTRTYTRKRPQINNNVNN